MTKEEKAQEETWQEVNPETSKTWDEKKDDTIQGVYTGKKENVGVNKSTIYILDVKGENIGVWGSTVLDGRFENIKEGTEVKIEYLGYKDAEKGGKSYKDYRVFQRALPFKEVDGEDELPVIQDELMGH
jgi:hypothetical protein|tara:strand:- start:2487 stop:2873 length:387 start_codon:yes stop_codon:yes gene_type:complete